MIALLISIRRLKNVLRTSAREVVTVLAMLCACASLRCDADAIYLTPAGAGGASRHRRPASANEYFPRMKAGQYPRRFETT